MEDKIYIWGRRRNSEELNKNMPVAIERLNIVGSVDSNSQILGTRFFKKNVMLHLCFRSLMLIL